MLVEDGILLRKYWFSVSDAEQQRRPGPDRPSHGGPFDPGPALDSAVVWEDEDGSQP
jgi:hypothetical protein